MVDWQDIVVFIFFFTLSIMLPTQLKFVLLGAVFILLGPLLIAERWVVPVIKDYPKLAVPAAVSSVLFGGACWGYAFAAL